MKLLRMPLWLVGFRPFFILTCLTGLLFPLYWVGVVSAVLPAPRVSVSIFQWHAHEMFYGFGWALLGGFLLTATKNWVHVRGWHGTPVALLTAAWLLERVGMWFQGAWPAWLFRLSNNLFLPALVGLLLTTLLVHRKKDTYRDNWLFVVALPLFWPAKWLLLMPGQQALGVSMTLGLFRLAFLIMLERTLTQFMKAVFQVAILRNPWLDGAIKGLGLLMVVQGFLPPAFGSWTGVVLGVLLLARLAAWKPQVALRRLDVGIMYGGYLALVAQLGVEFAGQVLEHTFVGATSMHVFSLGTIGLIAPAMVVRISKGHTGRKVEFDRVDKAVLLVMVAAFLLRVVGPQLDAGRYPLFLLLASGGWFLGFGTLSVRYIPFLLRARVDGKEH